MTSALLESRPRPLPNKESAIADEASEILSRHAKHGEHLQLCITSAEQDEMIVIPATIVPLLLGMLRMQANGLGIALMPLHSELTTGQAADILNVSRPYLIKLLEAGEIPYHKVGKHRRILMEDLILFKDKSQRQSRAAMQELVALSEDLGLYDL